MRTFPACLAVLALMISSTVYAAESGQTTTLSKVSLTSDRYQNAWQAGDQEPPPPTGSDQNAPLPPGNEAGTDSARLFGMSTGALLVGGAVIATGVCLAVCFSNGNHSSTTTTTSGHH